MTTINPIYTPGLNDMQDPVIKQTVITPDDNLELGEVTRGIAVNASGLVTFVPHLQSTEVTRYLIAGVDYAHRVKKVLDTGTDMAVKSAGIFGLY